MMFSRTRTVAAITMFLVSLVLGQGLSAQERDSIAAVERVQGEVSAAFDGQARDLKDGAALYRHDTLLTGPDSLVTARLLDGSELTLGAEAAMTLDDLIAPPSGSLDRPALRLLSGAFRLIAAKTTGAQVELPVATIGIRGTDFWGGLLDGEVDVLLLEGVVEVRNAAGAVILDRPGVGTTVSEPGAAPTEPTNWAEEKVQRAFATITYR